MRAVVVLAVLAASPAAAEPWYEGSAGRRRLAHLAGFGLGGALYISSETFLKDDFAPLECRLCSPSGADLAVRDALRWDDPETAVRVADLTGFVIAPAVALTLTAVASRGVEDRVGRVLDDTLPIAESAVLAGLLGQVVKFSLARRRPFVQFGDPARPAELDDNLAFYSGHTTLAFALATSAGLVARRRGYRLEPVIWTSGYAIAAATAYLRIAADRHYLTDTIGGALAGTMVGLAVPLLLHRHIRVTPAPDGVSIATTF